MLLEELVQDPLWGVRTYNAPRQGPGDEDEILTPQVSYLILFLLRASARAQQPQDHQQCTCSVIFK